MSVFGIPIEGSGFEDIQARIETGAGAAWIVTANPEILIEAKKNDAYKEALKDADVRTVDGFGLYFFERFVLRRKIVRLTGVELSEKLIAMAEKKDWKLGLFGGSAESRTALIAAEKLREIYPRLQVHPESGGSVSPSGEDDSAGEEAKHRMTLFEPDVLLVALGHPKQEFWIQRNKDQFPHLKVVVGVGGTLDFFAGNVIRAPNWMRGVGLEWLWRLLQEPKRIGRIFRAVIIFPFAALFDLLQSK